MIISQMYVEYYKTVRRRKQEWITIRIIQTIIRTIMR